MLRCRDVVSIYLLTEPGKRFSGILLEVTDTHIIIEQADAWRTFPWSAILYVEKEKNS